jgi:hypothetical protein
MGTKAFTQPILVALNACLEPRGFTKSGSTFRLRTEDTICIVSLQSSTSSTSLFAKVTVNLGVHIPALQDAERPETNPSVWSTHWRERIGNLMPDKSDVWWSIQTTAEADIVASEIAQCVEKFALPALAEISTVSALRKLWQSGSSPGLTEVERVRHLQDLAQAVSS